MKIFRGILIEIAAMIAAGFLLFLLVGVVGSFFIWGNFFADEDAMLGLRLFTGAGFAVGVVRASILLYYGRL